MRLVAHLSSNTWYCGTVRSTVLTDILLVKRTTSSIFILFANLFNKLWTVHNSLCNKAIIMTSFFKMNMKKRFVNNNTNYNNLITFTRPFVSIWENWTWGITELHPITFCWTGFFLNKFLCPVLLNRCLCDSLALFHGHRIKWDLLHIYRLTHGTAVPSAVLC